MQSKSISQTLLNNSQISGVELKTLDTNLSDIGHGLYIESISKDRYADLRMCCDKPFWGHTHPLMIQYQFDNFSEIQQDSNFSTLDSLLKKDYLKQYTSLQLNDLDFELTGQKIHLILNEESDLSEENLNLIDKFSQVNDLIIEECDLVLYLNDKLFVSSNIDSVKILSFSFFEYSLITETDISKGFVNETSLLLSAERYIDFLLLHADGKLQRDQNLMDEYTSKNTLQIKRVGNYLKLPKGNLTQKLFLEVGLLINDKNFTCDSINLAIPASCTKEELLDTLERVLTLLKR